MAVTNRTKSKSTPLSDVPSKIYYSISEVSDFTGVEPHVLRYWETKFTRLNPKRVGGNQRKYTRNDVELLYEIVHLLYSEGYTLEGAERKLRGGIAAVREERKAAESQANTVTPEKNNDTHPGEAQSAVLQSIKKDLQEILKLLD